MHNRLGCRDDRQRTTVEASNEYIIPGGVLSGRQSPIIAIFTRSNSVVTRLFLRHDLLGEPLPGLAACSTGRYMLPW